jgi:hypothetical protein
MRQTIPQLPQQDLRSALDIIALAAFASSLSTRALDPVLPHIADEFAVSIATAAGVAAGYMLTFAVVQPLIGPMADLLGKARLMVGCLVLLGLTNVLSAFANSFFLLFAMRILAGIASGGVVPVALGLISDLVGPDQRQVAIGRIMAGVMVGTLLGASMSGLISDFQGWRGSLAVLGVLGLLASVAVTLGFGSAAVALSQRADLSAVKNSYRVIFTECAHLLFSRLHRGLLCVRPVSLHRLVHGRSRTDIAVNRRHRDRWLRLGRFVLHCDDLAHPAQAWRQGGHDHRRRSGRTSVSRHSFWIRLEGPVCEPSADGVGILPDPWLPAGPCQRAVRQYAGDRDVAARVLLQHRPDDRADRLRFRSALSRQTPDTVRLGWHHGCARSCMRAAAGAAEAGGGASMTGAAELLGARRSLVRLQQSPVYLRRRKLLAACNGRQARDRDFVSQRCIRDDPECPRSRWISAVIIAASRFASPWQDLVFGQSCMRCPVQ